MKARFSLLTLSALSAAITSVSAGEPPAAPVAEISTPSAPSRWRFGAGYAPLLGLKTEFSGLGKFNSAFNPQPLGGGVDRDYDDGFVHLDSSGNVGGKTWNWGYERASQLNPQNGGSIDYSLTNSLSNGRVDEDSSASAGVELFTYYDMGAVGIPGLKDHGATWGFRGGLHYARIQSDNGENVTTDLTKLTDHFSLDGVIPPLAPYTGSFGGPGPLLGDSPTRTISSGGQAVIVGSRDLDVHLTTFNFGSYLELPLTRKLSFMVEGGVSAAVASGSYDFKSATTVTGLGTQTSSGSDSGTKVLPGVYLGLSSVYQINTSWAIQASGRYQYMDDFDLGDNGSNAVLSFDSAFVVSLGVVYSF
jgi:hypothetical protein